MRLFGRLMQRLALLVLPLAVVLQLSRTLSVGQMLVMSVAAVCLFWIGRLIEGYSAR